MRTLNLTELHSISGGTYNTTTVVEENTTVVVVYQPSPFLYDLAFLVVDVALRLLIDAALYDDNYYYCDGYYCYY